MFVTAKDLRFNISQLFDFLSKGEDITITYRGKPRAKLIPIQDDAKNEKTDIMFGMLKDDSSSIDEKVRSMRKGRKFDI